MTVLHRFLSLFFFFLLLTATAAECATQLTVDPVTGLPSSISDPQKSNTELIAAPVKLTLRKDWQNGPELAVSAVTPAGSGAYTLTLPDPDFSMELKYGQTEFPYLEWSVENKSSETKNCYATFALTLPASANRSFFPAGENAHLPLTQGMNPVSYSYGYDDIWPGARLALPIGQMYSTGSDWGLTFFGEYGPQIEDLGAKVSRSGEKPITEVSLNIFQLEAGKKAVRRLYFAVTEGDWRPALGALLVRYRQGFEPRNPDVAKLSGPFINGCLNSNIQDWHREGARMVHAHCKFRFYGEYIAQKEPWTVLVDDWWHYYKQIIPSSERPGDNASWQEIESFVETKISPYMTNAKVNDFLSQIHSYGMKGIIYWNPTEAWAPWAAEKFPEDRVMRNGQPVPAWLESVGMIADKQRPWGVYILNQLKEQLRIYPHIDGVFFDMATDGNHSLTELCREACEYVRGQGKICWWNGPYNMELAALADGLMQEWGGAEQARQTTKQIQYYGILGKSIISQGPYSISGYSDMLIHGIIPQPISNDYAHGSSLNKEQQEDIRAHWHPLFKWLRGRRWVLDAHALETSAGVEANIFRTPENNLVVPVVPDPFPTDTSNPLFDIGVTVRLPDVSEVRGVYLLTPDLLGYHQLSFTLAGDALQTKIPRLQNAGMLVLAKTGIFPTVAGALTLARGQQEMVHWTVDNWTDQTKLVPMRFESHSSLVMQVKPGKNPVSLAAPVTIPADNANSRFSITASAKVDGEELAGKIELWNDPPLLVLEDAPDHIRADEVLQLPVRLVGHFPAAKTVKVKVSSPGWQFDAAEKSVTLQPDQPTAVDFTGHPLVKGQTTISITAATEDQTFSGGVTAAVDVWAVAITAEDLSNVQSAELIFDSFGADGGESNFKPLSINGALVGNLPSSMYGDQWYNGHVMQLTTAAVAALGQSNEIRIDNSVKDPFKVRNFQLKLHLPGNITAVSNRNSGVYTGCSWWLHGEGTQFQCEWNQPGQPLTGIMVNFAQ